MLERPAYSTWRRNDQRSLQCFQEHIYRGFIIVLQRRENESESFSENSFPLESFIEVETHLPRKSKKQTFFFQSIQFVMVYYSGNYHHVYRSNSSHPIMFSIGNKFQLKSWSGIFLDKIIQNSPTSWKFRDEESLNRVLMKFFIMSIWRLFFNRDSFESRLKGGYLSHCPSSAPSTLRSPPHPILSKQLRRK